MCFQQCPLKSQGMFLPLMIASPDDVKIVEKSISGDGFVGLILTHNENAENPDADDLYRVGTAAKIIKKVNLPDGGVNNTSFLAINTLNPGPSVTWPSRSSMMVSSIPAA